MREIKFRGKRLDNGEWEYGDLLQYDDGSVCIGVHSKNYTECMPKRMTLNYEKQSHDCCIRMAPYFYQLICTFWFHIIL